RRFRRVEYTHRIDSRSVVLKRRIMKIAFLGMGIIGSRMARNLLKHGHDVTVWNRTAARCVPLEEVGARRAESPAEAARAADAVMSCLSTPAVVESVYTGETGVLTSLHAGQQVIEFSTVAPALTEKLDVACRAVGASFLEAPLTGSKNGAEA